MKSPRWSERVKVHICKSCCRSLTTKRRPKPDPNHSWRQPYRLQAQSVSENRGHQHRKIALEQCHKHGGCAIYVPQQLQLLLNGSPWILQVNENPTCAVPNLDHRTIWLKLACTQRVCPLGNETSGVGSLASRNTSQQTPTTQIGTTWISQMRQHTGALVPQITAFIFHTCCW